MIDESSWPHCGYIETGSRICGRLYQNKKLTKVSQTVLCMDAGRFQIRAYMHHHKLYNHKKQGWLDAGPYKLYILQCALLEMVCGSMSNNRKLFHQKPTTTVDNYFGMDNVIDWVGNEGLGRFGKNERSRIPKDTEQFYLNK